MPLNIQVIYFGSNELKEDKILTELNSNCELKFEEVSDSFFLNQ